MSRIHPLRSTAPATVIIARNPIRDLEATGDRTYHTEVVVVEVDGSVILYLPVRKWLRFSRNQV